MDDGTFRSSLSLWSGALPGGLGALPGSSRVQGLMLLPDIPIPKQLLYGQFLPLAGKRSACFIAKQRTNPNAVEDREEVMS